MGKNNDIIVPVEIRMLKFLPQTNNNGHSEPPIMTYLKYLKERYDEKYGLNKNKKPKIFVFRCFGWFDYFLLIFNPHIRCIENYDYKHNKNNSENIGVMTTSFVLWMSSEYNIYTENIYDKNLLGCIKSEFFNNSSNNSKLSEYKIEMKNNNKEGGSDIYYTKTKKNNEDDLIYTLSFIKLNEQKNNNNGYIGKIKGIRDELNKSTLSNNKKGYIIDYIIFDYLGIWDITILVSLKCENLKDYKNNFLVSCEEIQQSSSIILVPVGAKDMEILSNK